MWADERTRGKCAFNGLDSSVKRIVRRPTPDDVGMGRADEQSFPTAGFVLHPLQTPLGSLHLKFAYLRPQYRESRSMHDATKYIRAAKLQDAADLATIYNHYIAHTIITFEEEVIDSAEMAARLVEVTAKLPWIVWEEDGEVLGYAYASSWKSRCAYRHSVESTVYLRPGMGGRGIGYQLYMALLAQLQALGLHAAIGGIALPNVASVALHEKCGFQKIGEFIEVGHKFGNWINVGYWQYIFPPSPNG
jgi:L-amino acid N-acyltransferase YncA